MNTLAERLKFSRERAGLTQQQVAEKTGMSQPTYFKVEKGITKRTTYLTELANLFGVSPTWLATGKGEPEPSAIFDNNVEIVKINKIAPVINVVQAGKFTHIGDNSYDEYLPYFGDYGNDSLYWLCIQGKSMLPDFKEGEYVLINKDRQPTAGNYVVALKHGETKATFKKYRPKGYDNNGTEYWQLIPTNEEFPIIDSRYEPFDVIGVAVERNQRLV